jgi:hypothetical protein
LAVGQAMRLGHIWRAQQRTHHNYSSHCNFSICIMAQF